MNGREKVSASARRIIILKALEGDETQAQIAKAYGLDKSHVSRLVAQAKTNPDSKLAGASAGLEDARNELSFRKRVIEVLAQGAR